MKNIFIFCIFFYSILSAEQKYTNLQIKEDFNILKTVTCEVSPNLSKKEKEECYKSLNKKESLLPFEPISTLDFFKFLIQKKEDFNLDEHAQLSFPNNEMERLLAQRNILFPIPIIIIGEKLVVNYKQSKIPYGSIIEKINNKPISDIMNDIIKTNNTYTRRKVENMFDLIYFIKYGAKKDFQIEYKTPKNELKKIKLDAISIGKRQKQMENAVYPLNKEGLNQVFNTFIPPKSDIFYLRLNSFSNFNRGDEEEYFYNNFYKIFKQIKKEKIKNLVIDLRFNEGGNIVIPSMLYYFMAKDTFEDNITLSLPNFNFPYKQYIKAINYKSANIKDINNLIEELKKEFNKKGNRFVNTIEIKVEPKLNDVRFLGNVYLLISGRTFSSATYFTSIFKTFKRGKIIGEQIGGSHHNMTSGKEFNYILPNTKIELNIPIILLKLANKIEKENPKKYIQPDIIISEKVKYEYFLKKKDWDIEEAIKIINKGKIK